MKHIPKYLKQIPVHEKAIFRGQADIDWELKPSIGRHFTGDWSAVQSIELHALSEFKRRSIPHIQLKPISDIEWLCLMQHHGCATRLLDFTTNPLIALFFATDPVIEKDGLITVGKYLKPPKIIKDEDIFKIDRSFIHYPSHITERIIGQSGCFVCSCAPNKCLKSENISTINIPREDKDKIRYELRKIDICQATLFPGLDGLCKDLNDDLVLSMNIKEILS